eukprot:1331851-Amorphochlora_amoeboformis.AAC.1
MMRKLSYVVTTRHKSASACTVSPSGLTQFTIVPVYRWWQGERPLYIFISTRVKQAMTLMESSRGGSLISFFPNGEIWGAGTAWRLLAGHDAAIAYLEGLGVSPEGRTRKCRSLPDCKKFTWNLRRTPR